LAALTSFAWASVRSGVQRRYASATAGLVIAPYVHDHDEGFYLFPCDEVSQELFDSWHETLEHTLRQAEADYPGVANHWTWRPPPG
jgi:hypothetical protein